MAKTNDLSYANQLIAAMLEEEFIEVAGLLIEWFEGFGVLKWSTKKKKLVNDATGRWYLEKAKFTPWSGSVALSKRLLSIKGMYDNQSSILFREKEISRDTQLIHEYLISNPRDYNPIGKFGLPADKKRWGKYKLKPKRK